MHEPRIAFAAEYWGEGAVVCRASEDRPGPVVDQQFGFFETWTRANTFANKLNEGLELSPEQAGQIVRSALLARTEVVHAGLHGRVEKTRKPHTMGPSEGTQHRSLELLIMQMDIAIAVYRSARLLRGSKVAPRTVQRGREVAEHAVEASRRLVLGEADREKLRHRYDLLQQELDAFPVNETAHEVA